MSKSKKHVEIVVIGVGIVGISCAYYFSKKYQKKSILLIDSREPMSYTSAQSGDNYRNWWPSQTMTDFTNHSIALMEDIAQETNNIIQMERRGYALATRQKYIDDLLATLNSNYNESKNLVRHHQNSTSKGNIYQKPLNSDWKTDITGVDVLSNKELISQTFPHFGADIKNVIHVRKAGEFSSQQMGQWMLQSLKEKGISRHKGLVSNINKNQCYELEVQSKSGVETINADVLVNAAGPFIGEIAQMLDVNLPIENIFHQKIAFQDYLTAIPRNQAFSIDIDETILDWSADEKSALAEDNELSWLTKPIDGGIHSRPEGQGNWVKLGWAYNRETSIPNNAQELIEDSRYDSSFPEIVLRGASRLNSNLLPYVETLPTGLVHYGGYYTMTKENWPLIGPLDDSGAFLAGALSGFGSMSACATGALCADWVCGGELPNYAHALSLNRFKDERLMKEIESQETGIL